MEILAKMLEGEAAKMTERLDGILAKKEEACVMRFNVKETCMAERFNILTAATDKKLKLEEKKAKLEQKKVEIVVASEDSKMLTLKMEEVDDDARMIVQAV